ncbi:MAG: O-antigen ligase family protein [Acidobacteriaceae bacterium]|nr:O-antigen ligase family protein [Acidobacteriaceae bacterium]
MFYLLLILATASLVTSSVFSGQVWVSLAGTAWRRLGAIEQVIILAIAAVVAARVYADRTTVRPLMLGMESAGALASIYAILQYAGWDPLIPASVYTLGLPAAVRPPATLTQATYFATFLLGPISIAAWFRLRETSWRWKRAHEAVLCATIVALILSGTRAALVGLVAGACIFLYSERARFFKGRSLIRAGWIALTGAAVLMAFVLSPAGTPMRARIAQWTSDRAGGPRLLVWRDSLPLVAQHPLLGIGPERFEGEFRRVESLDLARAFPDYYHESPHNLFLEIAVGQGLIGLVAWVGLLGYGCWLGIACLRRGETEATPLCAALIAMLIALQFCPLTLTNELYVLPLSATLVALSAPKIAIEPRRAVPGRIVTASARAASVGLVFVAWAYAEQATLYDLTESRASKRDLAGAERSYEAAREFPMPGADLAVSQQVATIAQRSSPPVRVGALRLAEQAAEAAELNSADGFNGLYESAMLEVVSGNIHGAETKLREVVDAAPTWYRPRMALASVLWWERQNEEAEREADTALNCAGRMQANVRRTLQAARAQAALAAARVSR